MFGLAAWAVACRDAKENDPAASTATKIKPIASHARIQSPDHAVPASLLVISNAAKVLFGSKTAFAHPVGFPRSRSSSHGRRRAWRLKQGSEMDVQAQIQSYIAGQAQPKRDDLQTLHRLALGVSPHCRLWFLDGRNDEGKVVSNPNIGYGVQARRYANGDVKEFYQVGLSANTTGISIYIMGLSDKTHLSQAYGQSLGKAKITGYCVTFRSLKDVNLAVVESMVADHLGKGAAPQS